MPNPLTSIVYNPFAGRGRARKLIDNVRTWAAPGAELFATEGPGHGIELTRRAIERGAERVVAAGGDGTVHEVANGILTANNPEAALAVWPIGSSNDYAFSLGLDAWWKAQGNGVPLRRTRVDVGRITGAGRETYFANCSGVGFNGMVALESRKIRWLRGIPLYALAFLRAMVHHFRTPVLNVRINDITVSRPTLALTVNVGKKEGGFPITLHANLDDGRFDYLHVADVKRWELIRYLPGLILGRLPTDHPKLVSGTTPSVHVSGGTPLCVHADGEFFCKPDDGVTEVTFETLPGRMWVEMAG